jgi:hypothetical protein
MNIDTPQLIEKDRTTKTITSLRPNGGRPFQGGGGGVGGRSAFTLRTVYTSKHYLSHTG